MAKRTDDKGRILRSGEQQRSQDGRYLYRYTDIIGRRKTIYALTLQELREKERELQRDLEDGIDIAAGEMTLNQLFDLLMETKSKIRQSTKIQYTSYWKNDVAPSEIGQMKIKDIKAAHISKLYAEFTERGLCAGTIREIHKLIKASFELAVDSDMIRKNPAKNCGKYISGGKHKRDALTRSEQAELVTYIQNTKKYQKYSPMFNFMLNTGVRASELCGLRWQDVDLKEDIVHIRQQLIYNNYDGEGCKFYASDLKTENAVRDIPLTADAKKALLNQREMDMASGKKKHEVAGASDYVFTNREGNPFNVNAIYNQLTRIVKEHNENEDLLPLPHMSPHILRHSFATRCCEAGMDAKTLQIILGHSDISLTLNVYVQMDSNEVQRKFHEAEQAIKVV